MRGDDRGVVLGLYRSRPSRDLLERALSLGVRGIDTAYNYGGFTSHRTLARVASDLLGRFTVSTKVGFFPTGGAGERPAHSLEPARLRDAIEQSAEDLGRCPDVILLHNPERTLSELPTRAGGDRIVAACSVLGDAVTNGLCGAWGIATWDPRSVVSVFNEDLRRVQPAILLHRVGLSVPELILLACEQLCQALRVSEEGRWGMSPFGGGAADPAWRTANIGAFLVQGQQFTNHQAAFRLAYELPAVTQVAVGTSNAQHLKDLAEATDLAVSDAAIQRYRQLISQT